MTSLHGKGGRGQAVRQAGRAKGNYSDLVLLLAELGLSALLDVWAGHDFPIVCLSCCGWFLTILLIFSTTSQGVGQTRV
ncbi:uncharacterized protein LOC120698218 isoform X2 [Panicum virgatum]|uniref:uncharacterized protein LOC120698218 isoform X2 n=1 Tax=Panicum virgatum TaxID=38727 RepID=UPI0019D639B2|nr:uncharacterized protein LOC120698218 isoform X2 [Panicum virgatum]